MRRTTVMLSDEVDDLLRHEARRLGITVSQLTREAIETHLGVRPRRHFLAAGAGSSGDPDLTTKIEEILAEGFGR